VRSPVHPLAARQDGVQPRIEEERRQERIVATSKDRSSTPRSFEPSCTRTGIILGLAPIVPRPRARDPAGRRRPRRGGPRCATTCRGREERLRPRAGQRRSPVRARRGDAEREDPIAVHPGHGTRGGDVHVASAELHSTADPGTRSGRPRAAVPRPRPAPEESARRAMVRWRRKPSPPTPATETGTAIGAAATGGEGATAGRRKERPERLRRTQPRERRSRAPLAGARPFRFGVEPARRRRISSIGVIPAIASLVKPHCTRPLRSACRPRRRASAHAGEYAGRLERPTVSARG